MYAKPCNRQCSKHRQAGITTLGLIILVAFVGLFAFAGIRLAPVYLNYMKVAGVISGVHREFDGANATRASIRTSISRRFEIESVSEITARDVKEMKVEGGHEVIAAYSHKAPYVGNVSFVVDFDKRVLVRR